MSRLFFILTLLLLLIFISCKKESSFQEEPKSPEILSARSGSGTGNGKKWGSVKDIDGNIYRTIQIGRQIWMADNLRVTRYRNGEAIPELQNGDSWNYTINGAWCHFGNQSAMDPVYGKLYNWYAVNDSRGLAPRGWHIPTAEELNELITTLGGTDVAGGALKEIGTTYWASPNTGATNSSGFSARPGGYREYDLWRYVNYNASFWTSTIYNNGAANALFLDFGSANAGVGIGWLSQGFSVRCVKD